jgi:hypothetical protein
MIAVLDSSLLEGRLTLTEIIDFFSSSFPYFKEKITEEALREYALKNIPNWKEKAVESLEKQVEKQIAGLEESETFVSDEEKKVDTTRKHRQLLKELWENYRKLKISGEKRQEANKARYLELMSKELIIIEELEEKEKGLLSMLDEVRKAEEAESADEHRSYVEGYALPLLARKAETPEKAVEQLDILKKNLEAFRKILVKASSGEEAVRLFLEYLYKGKEK